MILLSGGVSARRFVGAQHRKQSEFRNGRYQQPRLRSKLFGSRPPSMQSITTIELASRPPSVVAISILGGALLFDNASRTQR